MPTSSSTSLDARKQRWRALLTPGAGPGFLFHISCAEINAGMQSTRQWPAYKAERIETRWNNYQVLCRHAELFADDRLPFFSHITGTEIFAEALGCRVERPADNMPFALPCVFSAAQADRVRVPELSTSTLAYLFDIADELQRRGGTEALHGLVDVQSPMDIAALVWEKADLLVAMIEEPEAVQALAAKTHALLTAFLDEWFARYGTEFIAHFPEYFMPGGLTLSEDEIGAVNAEMFDEFFAPHLGALSERYGGIGIHCCADAGHQWAGLRAVPGLRLLNLCCPPTRTTAEYILPGYAFFARTCMQCHGTEWCTGAPATWPAQFPAGARVLFSVEVQTIDEGKRVCEALNALRA